MFLFNLPHESSASSNQAPEWFLFGGLCLVATLAALQAAIPGFVTSTNHAATSIAGFSTNHGYIGALLAGFLANALLFIPVPYSAIIFTLGAAGLNPLLLGLIGGIGTAAGEVPAYALGALGFVVGKKRFARSTELLRSLLVQRKRFVYFVLFLAGASPLADDFFTVPLGVLRYNLFWSLFPITLGKVLSTTIIALFGMFAFHSKFLDNNAGTPIGHIVVVLFLVLFFYALMKVRWENLAERLLKKEMRG